MTAEPLPATTAPGAARPPHAVASLVGYYAALAGVGLVAAVLGPTLSGLALQTGATLSAISVLFVAKSLGYLVGSLVAGRLYDRLPGHPLMVLAGVLMALALAAMPLAPWVWLLTVLMVLAGAAEATTDVGSNSLVVWTYADRVGPYMNGLHFAFGLGAFLAPLIVAQALAWSGGIAWAYWALAILIVMPSLWLLRLPSPAGAHATAQAARGVPVRYGVVALFVACFFFYVGAEVGFGSWVYTYANVTKLADATSGAYLNSAFWGALTAGRLLSIPLATRFRPRTLLAVDLVGCLVSVSLVLFWTGNAAVLWIGTLGTGLAMASVFPTLMAMASRRMALTGQISSLFFIGGSLGGMFFPWLIGQLFEPVGGWVAIALVLVGVVLDLAAFLALMTLAPQPVAEASRAAV